MPTGSNNSPRCVVIIGPTASGKSSLAFSIFSLSSSFSHRFPNAEIISADSMQAYRGMDIGTAKPSASELQDLPHRLIDIKDPSEQFTVGEFVHLAEAGIRNLDSEGKLPVIVGGTGFYVKHLVMGLPHTPDADPAVRDSVKNDLERLGSSVLRDELNARDPVSAARIHPNDTYRLTRALEVIRSTGLPLSSFEVPSNRRPDICFFVIRVERPKDDIDSRIESRVREMFSLGLRAEVETLFAAGYGPSSPGMRAIGYREFFSLPDGALDSDDASVAGKIIMNTKHYAKRQRTLFNSMECDLVSSPERISEIADATEAFLA